MQIGRKKEIRGRNEVAQRGKRQRKQMRVGRRREKKKEWNRKERGGIRRKGAQETKVIGVNKEYI